MKTPKPTLRWRIICADGGHAHAKPNREKAEQACVFNNTTPYGKESTPEDLVPVHRGCLPFRVQACVVGPWEDPDDAEELAVMLVHDWWNEP